MQLSEENEQLDYAHDGRQIKGESKNNSCILNELISRPVYKIEI